MGRHSELAAHYGMAVQSSGCHGSPAHNEKSAPKRAFNFVDDEVDQGWRSHTCERPIQEKPMKPRTLSFWPPSTIDSLTL